MNTKPTTTVEREAIDKANELTPIVKSLKGSFTAPKDFDYKKELLKRSKFIR